MNRRTLTTVAFATAMIVASACAPAPPVAVERSDRSVGQLGPDAAPGSPRPPDAGADRPPNPADSDLPIVDDPASDLVWGGCETFAIPPADVLGTSGWECTTLVAPMDPFSIGAGQVPMVELALTRHRATGDRRGSILINPGGPGGAGLATAWGVRGSMSAALLRSFDIVSWDPRGIGYSTPKIDCDEAAPPSDANFIQRCVEVTGPLSAYLSAPYSAADMEAIRNALGEDRLNFLGYSYGSILGATYAHAYSSHVGSFVLDGVTDPLVGGPDGPFEDGYPALADDGTDAAIARFEELCDASDRCLFSLDAATIVDDLADQVPALRTDDFAGGPVRVDSDAYRELIDSSMIFAGDWELLATALSDADRGDASALAALIDADAEREGVPDDGSSASDFTEANFMIYCADLGPQITQWDFCDAMPTNAEPLTPIAPVEVERDILVIGTEFDPLTPGHHAPEFAAALGDATHIMWQGVSHTAYPGWTRCIDDAVDAQFLRLPVPPDGTSCSFLLGVDDDGTIGDELFGQGDPESEALLERRFADRSDPACLAGVVNQESDQVISHVVLDVTSDVAQQALDDATAAC